MKSSPQIKLVAELKIPFVADVPTTSINPDWKQKRKIGCHTDDGIVLHFVMVLFYYEI